MTNERIQRAVNRISLPGLIILLQSLAFAQTCPMPIDPSEDFVDNFYQDPGAAACYAVNMSVADGVNATGDPSAVYAQAFYAVAPGYQLVVLGYFPNSRFMSQTVYDSHLTTNTNYIFDYQLPPLFSTMINPFHLLTPFLPKQMYGYTVSFGGTLGSVTPGCGTTSTFGQTVFDVTQIHSGYTWNGAEYPAPPPPFPVHETGPNTGGVIQMRDYIDYAYQNTGTLPKAPVVIVRQLSNGCAITAQQATTTNNSTGQPILYVSSGYSLQTLGLPYLNQSQIAAHRGYYGTAAITPTETYPNDTFAGQQAQWVRSSDWVGRNNTAAAYISTLLPQSDLTSFLSGTTVMRVRFQLPTSMPTIPCNATNDICSLTGNEAMRYFSLEFMTTTLNVFTPPSTVSIGEGDVLWALDDTAFVKSPSGQVTLIVGTTSTIPTGVTSANGYTYFNLGPYLTTEAPGFNSLLIRNMLPNATFTCSTFNVPSYTMEYNNVGGFMGAYVPTVDFPPANTVFGPAHSPGRANTCTDPAGSATPNFNFPRTPV
jgi:hypothetical protein